MSEADQRDVKSRVLLEYTEVKQQAAMLQEKLDYFATEFETAAKYLKNDLHRYLATTFSFPRIEAIDATAQNLKAALEKQSELKIKLTDFGVPI